MLFLLHPLPSPALAHKTVIAQGEERKQGWTDAGSPAAPHYPSVHPLNRDTLNQCFKPLLTPHVSAHITFQYTFPKQTSLTGCFFLPPCSLQTSSGPPSALLSTENPINYSPWFHFSSLAAANQSLGASAEKQGKIKRLPFIIHLSIQQTALQKVRQTGSVNPCHNPSSLRCISMYFSN